MPTDFASVSPTDTPAEADVRAILAGDGVHVVHFWAPWCRNSLDELDAGWPELVARHADVAFTFVTVWNGGASGAGVLAARGLDADRVAEVVATGDGSHEDKAGRRHHFLGLPLTWIPSTWVFHKHGQLAFALNYGEMTPETLGALIGAAGQSW